MAKPGEDQGQVLGPLEAEVMEILWRADTPLSVRDVLSRLNKGRSQPLAYTTAMTVMSRLADKEILRRRREGRGYVYEAALGDSAAIAVHNVLRDHGDAALTHFVEEARADPRALRRLARLLSQDS
ncbi:MAG TPA: BlaI/MecI/CopY family transcriptional regulator [Solirubrobacterales bacterium]|jgi:predicted transcriptional regulator|nr:BlaI/MecI/CopY family transcriptional regulator [Solirubrobacterales bacterium]